MIFCAIGTTPFSFYRMIHTLDEALFDFHEKLVLQTGQKDYKIAYQPTTIYKEITYKQMVDHISRARALVCHGGAGTVLLALQYGTVKPFVLPRRTHFKEHVDDHQFYFSQYMKSRGLIILPSDTGSVTDDLRAYLHHPPLQIHKARHDTKKQLEGRLTLFSQQD